MRTISQPRHQAGDGFGHRHFQRVGRAERQSVACRVDHRLQHGRMVVADDHRSPGADVVDVAVAVDVEQVRRPRRAATKNGSPPTDLKARTGELTPPGIRRWARANRSWERVCPWVLVCCGHGWTLAAGAPVAECRAQRNRPRWRAAATGSGASNTPLMTATRSAPASTSGRGIVRGNPADRHPRQPRSRRRRAARPDPRGARRVWSAKGRMRRRPRSRRPRRRGARPRVQVVVAGHADDGVGAQTRAGSGDRRRRRGPGARPPRRRPCASALSSLMIRGTPASAHSACSSAAWRWRNAGVGGLVAVLQRMRRGAAGARRASSRRSRRRPRRA